MKPLNLLICPRTAPRAGAIVNRFSWGAWLVALLLSWAPVAVVHAQSVTQSFNLRAGWNAIWLEVEPANSEVNAVLAGTPLVSLWTYAERLTSVDFIADVNEPVWNRSRWLVHVPTNRLESFQNTLFAMPGKRAYLLQVSNAFTLEITGRPVWRQRAWAPNAYTLRGLPVDPGNPPDFNTFFHPSSAHFDQAAGRLQKIYRLNRLGQWSLVSSSERITYGEAYWVFTKGGSDYVAPLNVKLDVGDALDFGASVSSVTLEFDNPNASSLVFSLGEAGSPGPLLYQPISTTPNLAWVPLTSPLFVPASAAPRFRLALRRNQLPVGRYASVLEIKDGQGTRIQLGVAAVKLAGSDGGGGGGGSGGGGSQLSLSPATTGLAGLWVGNASIRAVNEVDSFEGPTTLTPVANHFSLRLLVHVDASGVARLLKEVVQLWQNGTTTNDVNGTPVQETPGRFVLVTDERLFPNFSGSTLIDGTSVGRRISTIGFDFDAIGGSNMLPLSGVFGGGNTLAGTFAIGPSFPTNPFRHKFHPDHNNLAVDLTPSKEVYSITRQISLQFSNAPPPGVTAIDYGYRVQAGTYNETVIGLNKTPILCQGLFQLTRISDVAVLNQ